jgi:hypothetical protein
VLRSAPPYLCVQRIHTACIAPACTKRSASGEQ